MKTHCTVSSLVLAGLMFCGCMVAAEVPAFVGQPLLPTARAEVLSVRAAADVDVVYLSGGYDQGFRNGMECQVARGDDRVATVLLVDVRPSAAAALILSLEPERGVRSGDTVRPKLLNAAN